MSKHRFEGDRLKARRIISTVCCSQPRDTSPWASTVFHPPDISTPPSFSQSKQRLMSFIVLLLSHCQSDSDLLTIVAHDYIGVCRIPPTSNEFDQIPPNSTGYLFYFTLIFARRCPCRRATVFSASPVCSTGVKVGNLSTSGRFPLDTCPRRRSTSKKRKK